MGVNCGSTGLVPDCLGAQNSVWKLTYTIPRPPKILYKYSSTMVEFAEIDEGVEYEMEEIDKPDFEGGQCHEFYRFEIRGDLQFEGVEGLTRTIDSSRQYLGPILDYTMINVCTGLEVGKRLAPPTFEPRDIFYFGAGLKIVTLNGIFYEDLQNCTPYATDLSKAWEVSNPIPTGFIDNCGNLESLWTFRVFDCDNRKIFERTERERPEVQKVPCKLYPEDAKTINVDPRRIPIGLYLPGKGKIKKISLPKGLQVTPMTSFPDGRKRVIVKVVLATGGDAAPGSAQTILDIYSPPCCNIHPKVCWECIPCFGCPPDTCLKVLDRVKNKICCYGKNGKVIATVDPDCEDADC